MDNIESSHRTERRNGAVNLTVHGGVAGSFLGDLAIWCDKGSRMEVETRVGEFVAGATNAGEEVIGKIGLAVLETHLGDFGINLGRDQKNASTSLGQSEEWLLSDVCQGVFPKLANLSPEALLAAANLPLSQVDLIVLSDLMFYEGLAFESKIWKRVGVPVNFIEDHNLLSLGATIADFIESAVRSFLNEDEAVISGGVSMDTKQELRDLEGHINYASFLLAAGVSDIERQTVEDWIREARKTAFCLADQIDMYAIRSSSNSQLYDMKSEIGTLSIRELTTSIKRLKTVDQEEGPMLSIGLTTSTEQCQMPKIVEQRSLEPEDMMRLAGMLPFSRRIPSVPADAVIKMDDKIKKIEAFLAGPHSVLFITGGEGEGKTTLMKDVYEQKKKDMHGTDKKCFWVDIAESAGLGSLLRTVLEESKVDCDSIHEFQMIKMVRDTFKDKDCLIVLDNVQDTSVLYSLMIILKDLKWKIICLSRTTDIQEDPNQEVLWLNEDQEVLTLTGLEPYDSLKLLLSAAFCNSNSTNLQRENFQSTILQRENFNSTVRDDVLREAITWKYSTSSPSALQSDLMLKMLKLVNEILYRCQNNPSNIWSIGRLLQVNPLEDWEKIVERIDGMLIDRNKKDEKRETHIQSEDATLEDAATRHCFLYCLAFSNPKPSESSETLESSVEIPAKKLIRLWTAEGFVQDSACSSEEQEAERLLRRLIMMNLLVEKKIDFDGTVLKCSVNEHIRPMAEQMCEQQKFCKFVVVDDVAVKKKPLPGRYLMTRRLPISGSILGRGKKKPVLSDRYRMMAVHPDSEKEVQKTHTVGSFPSVSWSKKKEVPRTLGLGTEIRLRSLLYFNTGRIEHSKLDLSFGQTYMLLRTLELQGARLAKLSPGIGCLVCLRYLGLRNTQLEDLPPTWQSLRGLICLDIRDTNIAEVADVSQFREMRHLYLTNSFRSHSVVIRDGLHSLDNLQTLSGVAYGESSGKLPFEEQISRLRRLRKLSVKKASSTSSRNICQVISKIDYLQSLAISCDRDGQQFDLSDLNIGKNLCKLKLGGPLRNHFNQDQLKQMQSITFLYLWDSKLPDNPDLLHTLQGLKSLLVLSLLNTSMSEQMRCDDGGYKSLKKLSVISMQNLNGCSFGQNAMPNLKELVFAKCAKLKSLPQGLDQLRSLREVHLTQMHPDFCKEAKDKLGDKVHVLRDALSHVVSSRAATGGGS